MLQCKGNGGMIGGTGVRALDNEKVSRAAILNIILFKMVHLGRGVSYMNTIDRDAFYLKFFCHVMRK